jgi:hypothetical protein
MKTAIAASILLATSFAAADRASATEPSRIRSLLAGLNTTYAATVTELKGETGSYRIAFTVGEKSIVKHVTIPAELWSGSKDSFKPNRAGVVLTPSGELSSINFEQSGAKGEDAESRELWITFNRSSSGQCLAMVYPTGAGFTDVAVKQGLACGIVQDVVAGKEIASRR